MPDRALTDPESPPTEQAAQAVLADAYPRYQGLMQRRASLRHEWSFAKSAKSAGWLLKVTDRKKALFHLVPHHGGFIVRLTLREHERNTLLQDEDLAGIHPAMASTTKYAEGYLLQLDVFAARDDDILERVIEKLMALRRP